MLGKRPLREEPLQPQPEVKEKVELISMAKLAQLEEEVDSTELVVNPIEKGLGRFITSGRTVHGFESNFPS